MKRLYRQATTLEYILDSTNQKRKRQDKAVKKAWGYACNMKGEMVKALDYYQPTLLMIVDKYGRNEVNSTWTPRTQNLYHRIQKAKRIAESSSFNP